MMIDDTPLALELTQITAGYGETVVLRDVSLAVPQSSVVALLGANGAGKTTLLRVASGLLKPKVGRVQAGAVDITRYPPHRRCRAGLCLIPEGRGIFKGLTVMENLDLQVPPWNKDANVEGAIEFFPELAPHLQRVAGTLSGGEQQMLALARTRLAQPSVVLVDEVSMGLAPLLVDRIFAALRQLATTGVAIVLVEQYVNRALEMADIVSVLNRGSITYTGSPQDLDEEVLSDNYLGAT
jgi:branched-chain amino acid transport system ATP-binding protein